MAPLKTARRYKSIATAPDWVTRQLDACPKCRQADNRPLLWAISGDTLACAYRCDRCGHGWWTGRSVAAYRPEAAA